MLLAQSASSPQTYNLIWIVIGLFTLVGAGGVYGFIKWIKKSGVRDAKIDELLSPTNGVLERLEQIKKTELDQDREITDLVRSTRSNGLTTNEVGDIAARTEIAVNDIR